MPYEDFVREALCFGWIDSLVTCFLNSRSFAPSALRMTTLRRLLGKKGRRKIFPGGIPAIDQTSLPHPHPTFDPFFARDRVPNIHELFEVDESRDAIPAREAGQTSLVFVRPAHEVIGNADIQHPGPTRHYVHVVGAHAPQ
jgi:hypothetical protein